MKKATFFAAALLMGAAVCTTPLQAMAASSRQSVNIKKICVGNVANIIGEFNFALLIKPNTTWEKIEHVRNIKEV